MQHESRKWLNWLLTETGHVLGVEDFDDIAELDRIAAEVADPQNGIDSPMLNHAVYFRRVPVYPLTLAHLTYLDEAPQHITGEGDDGRVLCMLWVATLPEITDDHYNWHASSKAFRKWSCRCPWTPADVEAVLQLRYSKLLSNQDGEASENKDGALIGLLSREYGDTPEYWMRKAPLGVIDACVADWNAQQEAQAAAYRKANPKGGAAPPPSPKFVSMRKLRECAERIREKWLKSAA